MDLTGFSESYAPVNLNVRNNQITALDISNNTNLLFVWAEDNELETINIARLSSLAKQGLNRNDLDRINVSENIGIQLLTVPDNRLGSTDVSSNNVLTAFILVHNPLNCILANEAQLNDIPTDWAKDETVGYSLDCQ